MAHEQIEGWGADLDPKSRPGVPMEWAPHPAGAAHWTRPVKQPENPAVLKHPLRKELTPVFGTGEPPKGLSGLIRKVAYRAPDHKAKHWLLLMLADRVDVVERLVTRFPLVLPAALAGGVLAKRLKRA